MNKGFISIGLIIAIGVSAIVGALAGYISAGLNQPGVGATIYDTALTDTIGTFRTNVNTSLINLNNQLTSTTSTNPGHVHGLSGSGASVSGTLPIANGGTATTTFLKGVVTASGTAALSSVSPSTLGNVLTSDGANWVSSSTVPATTTWTRFIYTTSTTWTVPVGVNTIYVTLIGAGGGGQHGSGSTAGGGGGSGAAIVRFATSTTPGTSFPIVVGTAGSGGVPTPHASSTAGTATTIGTLSAGGGQNNITVQGTAGTAGVSTLTKWNGDAGSNNSSCTGGTGGIGWFGLGGTGTTNATATTPTGGYGGGGGGGGCQAADYGGSNGQPGLAIIEY